MKKKLLMGSVLGAALAGWLIFGDSALMISEYQIVSNRLPAGFEGFRIAQISDLHNAEFGEQNQELLTMLEGTKPDIIVLTGDLVDCRHPDLPSALSFVREAVKMAPCYYVTGNHESRLPDLQQLLDGLSTAGVSVLRNEAVSLKWDGDTITLLGVDDPAFRSDYLVGDSGPVLTAALNELVTDDMGYRILLSHRPEWFRLYKEYGIDLIFSGHAHGGQFRLPFVGGIVAPNQGFFPEFDAGVYTDGEASMVVSLGLGASIIPLRIHNRPELVVAELHRQEE